MPNLTFMWLMTDHTGATGVSNKTSVPIPVAQVADNDLAVGRVIDVMKHLRDAGNSLVVVEHDPQIMLEADRILDMGPGPGGLSMSTRPPSRVSRSRMLKRPHPTSPAFTRSMRRAGSKPMPLSATTMASVSSGLSARSTATYRRLKNF
ncbi:hypothetical protein B4Q13_19310 [Lacticaseibacillus rhamnosus]